MKKTAILLGLKRALDEQKQKDKTIEDPSRPPLLPKSKTETYPKPTPPQKYKRNTRIT